jgi:glycosyltransferase involved in cell wall biosynthesis
MRTIRLSIVIPTYNHAKFLEKRISSILSQIGQQDELIIVDDHSQDCSNLIIQKFVHFDERVKYIRNNANLGTIRSVNIAIGMAQGKYLSGLASDDLILPGFVEETMNALQSREEIGLCCSDYAEWFDGYVDKSSEEIFIKPLIETTDKKARFFDPSDIVRLFQKTNFWIPGHTAIVKKEFVEKYGGFDERLGRFSDWFLLHTIALHHGVAYVPKVLAVFRRNPESYSSKYTKRQYRKTAFNVLKVLKLPSNQATRLLFKKSGLLRFQISQHLFYFLIFPIHWDILIWWIRRFLILRWDRLMKWKYTYGKV